LPACRRGQRCECQPTARDAVRCDLRGLAKHLRVAEQQTLPEAIAIHFDLSRAVEPGLSLCHQFDRPCRILLLYPGIGSQGFDPQSIAMRQGLATHRLEQLQRGIGIAAIERQCGGVRTPQRQQ
jgi:hypothetical protein